MLRDASLRDAPQHEAGKFSPVVPAKAGIHITEWLCSYWALP
jgi:hypothetical protein